MLKRFFEAKSFIFHIPKPIQVPKIIHFGYFRHTVDPQGPFGANIKAKIVNFGTQSTRRGLLGQKIHILDILDTQSRSHAIF